MPTRAGDAQRPQRGLVAERKGRRARHLGKDGEEAVGVVDPRPPWAAIGSRLRRSCSAHSAAARRVAEPLDEGGAVPRSVNTSAHSDMRGIVGRATGDGTGRPGASVSIRPPMALNPQ